MEHCEEKADSEITKNSLCAISIEVPTKWAENITAIDLSNKNIITLDENLMFPLKLIDLDICHNNLSEISNCILKLCNLKVLKASYNSIKFFDDSPAFSQVIERLDMSHNDLRGPPCWVWFDLPPKLFHLDLSCNSKITMCLREEYWEEILSYTTAVTHLKINNCRIRDHLALLKTLPKLESLEFGRPDFSISTSNHFKHIPSCNMKNCCDIKRLDLTNTQLCNVDSNIDLFRNLIEINLSQNNLSSLPNEFCLLENLEICILSSNKLLYLPDNITEMKKLVHLCIDTNELCFVPENLDKLKHLKKLDLYDNCLYDLPDEIDNIMQLDLAQNFFEEPTNEDYFKKKRNLRLNIADERLDGRKTESEHLESSHYSELTDEEDLNQYMDSIKDEDSPGDQRNIVISAESEDWDSDEYWVPGYSPPGTLMYRENWKYFVKKKMRDGNFCPMEYHPEPAGDIVQRERMNNPKQWCEVEGQFDDLSDDSS